MGIVSLMSARLTNKVPGCPASSLKALSLKEGIKKL